MMDQRTDVLLAEDDDDLRDATMETLEDAGYRAVAVSNGSEALSFLREAAQLPSLILLDLMMPVMDGWQFREAQRDDPRIAAIPVVILSAMAEKPTMADVEYLQKPTKAPPLIAMVAQFCGLRSAT